jgi:uncharacterized protein
MILCDSGPLIALIDRRDGDHVRCQSALEALIPPLITTWACLTEAMYMLGRSLGHPAQATLWDFFERGVIRIHQHDGAEVERMQQLMEQYRNVPMDLGDASLVAMAEVVNVARIFTLDGDFRIYRLGDGRAFEIVPE